MAKNIFIFYCIIYYIIYFSLFLGCGAFCAVTQGNSDPSDRLVILKSTPKEQEGKKLMMVVEAVVRRLSFGCNLE